MKNKFNVNSNYPLFIHLNNEFGLILTDSELDSIILASKKAIKNKEKERIAYIRFMKK